MPPEELEEANWVLIDGQLEGDPSDVDMSGGGAVVFGYNVDDTRPFGVVDFDSEGKAISIEEKPSYPKSNFIVPGLYFYDNQVVSIVQELQASKVREISITDVNNVYLQSDDLHVILLEEQYSWFDAGTEDSMGALIYIQHALNCESVQMHSSAI